MHRRIPELSLASLALVALPAGILLSAAPSAQVVSPAGYAAKEANYNNRLPWSITIRYMQMHGDLRGSAHVIKGQSHRRDGVRATNISRWRARGVRIEMFAGEGDLARASETFEQNYTGAKTRVRKDSWVNLPFLAVRPRTAPAPFAVRIPYDRPFSYSGKGDLVWELFIRSNTQRGNDYVIDTVADSGRTLGTSTRIGTGCVASGQRPGMLMMASAATRSTNNTVRLLASTFYGVRNAPGVTLVGLRDPNLAVPGWCGRVHTDGIVAIPGRSDGAGTMRSVDVQLPFRASYPSIGGLYFQSAFLDRGQRVLPVAASQGSKVTVAKPKPAGKFANVWYPHPAALRGLLVRGSAVVTRFDK